MSLLQRFLDWWRAGQAPEPEPEPTWVITDSTIRCVSDLGLFKRHLYEGAPVCVRCGVDNPRFVEPDAVPSEGL